MAEAAAATPDPSVQPVVTLELPASVGAAKITVVLG